MYSYTCVKCGEVEQPNADGSVYEVIIYKREKCSIHNEFYHTGETNTPLCVECAGTEKYLTVDKE